MILSRGVKSIHDAARIQAVIEIAVHVGLCVECVWMIPKSPDETFDGGFKFWNEYFW